MNDDITTTESAAETTEAPVNPIDTISKEFDTEIAASGGAIDTLADFGVDAPKETRSEEPADEADKNSYQKQKREIERLKLELEDRDTRDQVKGALGRVKELYPNAYDPTIQRMIRRGAGADQIESIAQASHNDVERGIKIGLERGKAKLDKLRDTATQEAEATVKNAWGEASTSTPGSGKQVVTPAQFEEAALSRKLTEAQLNQMHAQVDWSK